MTDQLVELGLQGANRRLKDMGDGTLAEVVYARLPEATWAIRHSPAVSTLATATQAAGGAGVRHVLTDLSAVALTDAAPGAVQRLFVRVRDGASGAGTILYERETVLGNSAAANVGPSLSGLTIKGSPNTAMTVEFDIAGGASTYENVSAHGYDVVEA